MTLAPNYPARTVRPGTIAVNMAAVVVFCLMAALQLEPLLGSRAVMIFLACGGLLIVSNPNQSVLYLVKYWFLLLLPIYCGLSILWSAEPSETLRAAIQLGVTFILTVVIAGRIPPRTFVRIFFFVLCLTVLLSILFGRVRDDIGAWLGLFGSKNAFASVISAFALVSFATLLDAAAHRYERLIATFCFVLSLPLLVAAQSAGATMLLLPGLVVIAGLLITRRLHPIQRSMLMAFIMMAFVTAIFVLAFYWQYLLQFVLNSSGKDSTLTGRTDLWSTGLAYIAEHPLFGVGYRAFWVIGNPAAEQLWYDFGISTRSGFHFHNLYISNTVEIGLVGLALQLFIFLGAFWMAVRWCLKEHATAAALFSGYMTVQFLSSFIEVPVFFQFNITSVIVVVIFIYAHRAAKYE